MDDYHQRAALLYRIADLLAATDSYDELLGGLAAQGFTPDAVARLLHPVEADLHTHSNFSDGVLPPRKIVRLARLMGMKAVAVTDHDNVSGIEEAVREGSEIGIDVVAGLEFNAGRSGLEILAYLPDTPCAVEFLRTEASGPLHSYLLQIQGDAHRRTLAILPGVNEFLQQNGASPADAVTEAEIRKWSSGQEPFYPGTLAVLGLKRLSQERRDALDIHDPRVFNTKVITPLLKQLPKDGPAISLETVERQVAAVREAGVRCVTVLAHPIELTTKGKLSFDEAEALVRDLHAAGRIDGLEVNNSRDTAQTTARWLALAADIRSRSELPFYSFSFSSDFHVLAPGVATGEITLGFGNLDERPGHTEGNLRPQGTWRELAAEIGYAGA